LKEQLRHIRDSIAGSYSQVFFSDNPWLAVCLLLASFMDPYAGISGFISIVAALLFSKLLGLAPAYVHNGTYTYNVLLAGMALGTYFQFTALFVVILLVTALLTLFITVWLAALLSRYKLPFLSLPFIISVWIVLLNARAFPAGILMDRNVFLCDGLCNTYMSSLSQNLGLENLPKFLLIYFRAMGAIFFQTNIIAGVLVTVGLLIHSRIAFTLSWLGFLTGYFIFLFSHGSFAMNDYSGINYIFSAIALAGFYLVPSGGAYLLVIVSAPIIGLLFNAAGKMAALYYLPLYSMPFSLSVILILSVINSRYYLKHLHVVPYQLFSPEKNLYAFTTYTERFKKDTYIHMHLPFYGEWTVSQGYNGKLTHTDDFRFALDFVVTDEHKRTFRLPGKNSTDFYCYALPVLAPADGYVVTLEDGIEDNGIGDVNLAQNWGNTIIIKHAEGLYSKISHIKNGSFKVKEGDYVKKGEMLALCGNSGRSPEPHIHFQFQTTSYIGAKTLEYPISYYIVKKENGYQLRAFISPDEGDVILRPVATPLLKKAFYFIPGMKLNFEVSTGFSTQPETWEVFTDSLNNSYLYCAQTKSTAYFTNNTTLFYFTGFSGDRNSLLYYFYLAAYKVLLSYFPDIQVEDQLPVEDYYHGLLKPLQDVVAPFYIFIRPAFTSTFAEVENALSVNRLTILSQTGAANKKINFEIELSDDKIKTITVKGNNVWLSAENIG
jgi:urea transporter/murein DD-endopeptidase MepM/ murein hydrolase activator NlpD